MGSYLLYGCNLPLSDAKEMLSNILEIEFKEGSSDYHSGAYFRAGERGAENFELKINKDPFDGESLEQEFPDYSALFFINATARVDFLLAELDRIGEVFTLLRHENF